MWWILLLAVFADAGTTTEFGSHSNGPTILVVATPGLGREAYLPLTTSLRRAGLSPVLLEHSCRGQDAHDLAHEIEIAVDQHRPRVVLAHGLGATLVLMADINASVGTLVLMSPIVEMDSNGVFAWLSRLPVGPSGRLDGTVTWDGVSVEELLWGQERLPLTCAPVPFMGEVSDWMRGETVPVQVATIHQRVWVGISLGDRVSGLEYTVPGTNGLPCKRRVHFGVMAFHRRVFSHGDLLTPPIAVRKMTRAAVRGSRERGAFGRTRYGRRFGDQCDGSEEQE